jgi:hypothetical protein
MSSDNRSALRWALSAAAFLVVAAAVFIPVLFALAETPLHDGSDSPSPALLYSTLFASVVIAAVAAWLVNRWLRRRAG